MRRRKEGRKEGQGYGEEGVRLHQGGGREGEEESNTDAEGLHSETSLIEKV